MSASSGSLSTAQARRIALAAQGFLDPAHATPTMRTLDRAVARTGVLQVDSVNVLQRAHFMPLYARMGPYDVDLLRRASHHTPRQPRRLVEYWAHVQAFMPVDLWPAMRHRMEAYRAGRGKWMSIDHLGHDVDTEVLAAVRDRGPVTARDLEAEFSTGPRTKEHWGWNWSEARRALDYLFTAGEVAIARRNSQFEVVYDLTERVLPERVLNAPTPTVEEASRDLVRRAARSHGVATARCLADYYRMRQQPGNGADTDPLAAAPAIAALVEEGELLPVQVQGWKRPAYLHRDARIPRRVDARTLLSPFDPLVWERERTERLFGFRYRIEIYVPRHKRVHGYYVLPFLLGDSIVARVDLKADRPSGRLLVRAAFREDHAPTDVAEALSVELWRLAGWLGLHSVVVEPYGDLAAALGAEVAQADIVGPQPG